MNDWRSWWGIGRSLLIYYGQPWRIRRMRRFYRQFVQPGDLCFDIGAHLGNHTRIWRRLGARVVAVEPQPHLMRLLRRGFGRDAAVQLVEAAVGAAEGEAALWISRRAPTVSTLSADWMAQMQRDAGFAGVQWDRQVHAPVTTLDALIDRYGLPAFCKIDVEGSETAVLAGLSRPLPALSFEYIPAALDLAVACVERLQQLGTYQFAATVGERYQLSPWQPPQTMLAWLETQRRSGRSGDLYARDRDRVEGRG